MRGLIGKEECIVTKQNKSIKQFVLIVLSFLMVFGNVAVADAAVNSGYFNAFTMTQNVYI